MREPDWEAGGAIEAAFGAQRLGRCVTPYYLKLQSVGASRLDDPLRLAVRRQSQTLTRTDVEQLLQMHWRPRVMGAWYAIAVQDPGLSVAVHESLETCLGRLTAPPLITAALAYPNNTTASLLRDYISTDVEEQWGSAGFAVAALLRLEEATHHQTPALTGPPVSIEDLDLVDKLVSFGRALQAN